MLKKLLCSKETAKQRIRRKMAAKKQGKIKINPETGEEEFGFIENDLRYKHITVTQKAATNACIFFMVYLVVRKV